MCAEVIFEVDSAAQTVLAPSRVIVCVASYCETEKCHSYGGLSNFLTHRMWEHKVMVL